MEANSKEEAIKKRRPWKKVTKTLQYKGPISQKNEPETRGEHRQENILSPKLNSRRKSRKKNR